MNAIFYCCTNLHNQIILVVGAQEIQIHLGKQTFF